MRIFIKHIIAVIIVACLPVMASAQAIASHGTIIPLYAKGQAPTLGVPETSATVRGVAAPIIFNVSNPTLEMFRPAHANGTAVIVAPGGGFVGLGYDDEGTAVARRLVEHGITAFVLKYRTIFSPDTEMHMPAVHMKEMETVMARAKTGTPLEMPRFSGEPHAVEDGERAMAIVRQHAAKWGIDSHRIGFIGFSAGAYLAADLAIGEKASRPDFVGLI